MKINLPPNVTVKSTVDNQLTSADVNKGLHSLRNALRVEAETITEEYPFRRAVSDYLCLEPTQLDDTHIPAKTLARLNTLIVVPSIDGWSSPTQANYAWAIQNFLNRRAEPWSFYAKAQLKRAAKKAQEFFEEAKQ